MSKEQTMLLLVKGHISDLPTEDQASVFQARDEIRAITSRSDLALFGLALASAELAVENQ